MVMGIMVFSTSPALKESPTSLGPWTPHLDPSSPHTLLSPPDPRPPDPAPHLHTVSQDKLVDDEGDEVAAGHLPGDDEVAPVVEDADLDHQQRELGAEGSGHWRWEAWLTRSPPQAAGR